MCGCVLCCHQVLEWRVVLSAGLREELDRGAIAVKVHIGRARVLHLSRVDHFFGRLVPEVEGECDLDLHLVLVVSLGRLVVFHPGLHFGLIIAERDPPDEFVLLSGTSWLLNVHGLVWPELEVLQRLHLLKVYVHVLGDPLADDQCALFEFHRVLDGVGEVGPQLTVEAGFQDLPVHLLQLEGVGRLERR
jgi:hypothetical protein